MLDRLRRHPATQHARGILAARIAPKPLSRPAPAVYALPAASPQPPAGRVVHWTATGLGRTMTTTLHGHHDDPRVALSDRYAIRADCIRIL